MDSNLEPVESPDDDGESPPPLPASAPPPCLPPGNPWLTIWRQPRATLRGLFDKDPVPGLFGLYYLYGLNRFVDRASDKSLGDRVPLGTLLVVAMILAPVIGWLNLAFWGWVLRKAGEHLGGTGDATRVHAAVAWASLPRSASVLVWPVFLAVFGAEMFREEMPTLVANPNLAFVVYAGMLVALVLSIWSLVLLVSGLAEAHRFSKSRAAATIALGGGSVLLPVLVVVGAIYFTRG